MAKLIPFGFDKPAKNWGQARERMMKRLAEWPTAYPLRDAAPRILAAIRALPEVRR
jgi:hypothetical protein